MNPTFTADALRLAGVLCRSLGWRPADFWETTPEEIVPILQKEAGGSDGSLSRQELQNLMEQDRDG